MATCQGSTEVNCSIQSVQQYISNFNEEEVKEIQEAILKLSQRDEPVNILVTGPTGAGKSTLINAMMGGAVAKVSHGAGSVQSEVEVHEGEYEGIQLKVYDTTGFSDTRGKSGDSIVKEIAESNKFDLILICVKMNHRADEGVRKMFKVLGENLRREMWERSIIVLTCANLFLQQRSIRKSPNKAEIIRSEIEDFKGHIHGFLSDKLKKETIDEIPFRLAGEEDERKLPTTHDWLKDLWNECIKRSSEDAGNFLKIIANYRIMLMEAGAVSGTTVVGAVVGGAIGGAAGTVLPGTGNIIGAAAGAVIGGGIAAITSGIVVAVKKKYKNRNQPPPSARQED